MSGTSDHTENVIEPNFITLIFPVNEIEDIDQQKNNGFD